jgi:hypothetical protein
VIKAALLLQELERDGLIPQIRWEAGQAVDEENKPGRTRSQ